MKCDVCGSRIPPGQYECENCGYKMKQVQTRVYEASGQTHEHIPTVQSKKSYVPPKINIDLARKMTFSKDKRGLLIPILMTIVVFWAMTFIIIPRFYQPNSNSFEGMSLAEIIENNDDNNGSAQMAINHKAELNSFMAKAGFEEMSFSEYADNYDNQMTATIMGDGVKSGVYYYISLTYDGKDCISRLVSVSYDSTHSMRKQQALTIDKKFFNKIVSYIGIDNASEIVESNLLKMELGNESGMYEYRAVEEPFLYMTEKYSEEDEVYNQYISIDRYA